jgi:hypothetical protein
MGESLARGLARRRWGDAKTAQEGTGEAARRVMAGRQSPTWEKMPKGKATQPEQGDPSEEQKAQVCIGVGVRRANRRRRGSGLPLSQSCMTWWMTLGGRVMEVRAFHSSPLVGKRGREVDLLMRAGQPPPTLAA